MERIARAVEGEGAIVGHIKGYARQGGAFAHASVTAADIPATVEGGIATFSEGAEMQLVVIAMLISPEELLQVVANRWS